MLLVIVSIFPCLVALTWGFVYLSTRGKTAAQKLMMLLLFMTSAYMFVDSYFLSDSLTMDDYKLMVWLDVLGQVVVFTLPVLACLYVRSLENSNPPSPLVYALFLPGLVQSTAVLVLALVAGTDEAAAFHMAYDAAGTFPAHMDGNDLIKAYSVVTKNIYTYLLLAELIVAFVYLVSGAFRRGYRFGDVARFLGKGKVSKLSNIATLLILLFFVLCIYRGGMTRMYFLGHPLVSGIVSILFAAIIFVLAYFGLFISEKGFTRSDLGISKHADSTDAVPEISVTTSPEPELLTDEFPVDAVLPEPEPEPAEGEDAPIRGKRDAAEMEKTVQSLPPQQRLFFNFSMYMVEERPYLNPELTIIDVATALHSNRTYISALVAERYGMPFRDYINTQRINFAKTYILTHPDAILEEVAAASGFASASQFVKKFHQIENVSPRIWQANPDLSHNKVE